MNPNNQNGSEWLPLPLSWLVPGFISKTKLEKKKHYKPVQFQNGEHQLALIQHIERRAPSKPSLLSGYSIEISSFTFGLVCSTLIWYKASATLTESGTCLSMGTRQDPLSIKYRHGSPERPEPHKRDDCQPRKTNELHCVCVHIMHSNSMNSNYRKTDN